MNHYITPPAARKKLKAAKALGQTTYIYGAAGYGKTSFIQSELAKRKHVYLFSKGLLQVTIYCR